jgi:hypothetical protein
MSNAFFRVRQRLVKESRYGQLIGVAFAEMVLIIVGILLALQIDNWNQNRQERKITNDYLEIIKHNIAHDIKDLEDISDLRKQSLIYTDTILGYYRNEHISDPKLFELGFRSLFLEERFYPNRSAYESLKSSGFLRNVGNTRIEEGLNGYNLHIDRILNSQDVFNSLILTIEEKLSENGFYIEYAEIFQWEHNDTINFTYENLVKYPDVQSTFIRSRMWLEQFILEYTQCSNIGKDLLEELNNGD